MKYIWKMCYEKFFSHIFLGAYTTLFKRYQNTSGCSTEVFGSYISNALHMSQVKKL